MKQTLTLLTCLLLSPLAALHAAAPPAKPNSRPKRPATASNVSKVPKYSFATTLEEQERQLAESPLLERFRASRKELYRAASNTACQPDRE